MLRCPLKYTHIYPNMPNSYIYSTKITKEPKLNEKIAKINAKTQLIIEKSTKICQKIPFFSHFSSFKSIYGSIHIHYFSY
jgi:hypothetical protein